MKVVIITGVVWTCCLVAAQENVCFSECSTVGMLQSTPGRSCDDIYQTNKASRVRSGDYWINTTTGVHQVYCDMELECGGHKGGWMRIADLDTNRGDDCPSGWTKITNSVVACGAPGDDLGCYSTHFSTLNISYSKVCGMMVGYQENGTDGFHRNVRSIDDPYVDGASITFGTPRKHIWTYAIGLSHDNEVNFASNCPCAEFEGSLPPSFVQNNYYCESGAPIGANVNALHTDDPVWDGQGCPDRNNCCSYPNLPWFFRQLPLTANENIEIRLCRNEPRSNGNGLVKDLQLYVQ